MPMPNFFIIGAAKCGTTALFQYLRAHPQIFMCDPKEPFFFAIGNDPLPRNGPGDEQKPIVDNLEDYRALFDGVTDEIAIGDASTIYLYSKRAAHNINQQLPHAKLIAVLRNPVDRAYSSFMHLLRDGREPCTDFEKALSEEQKRIESGYLPVWHYFKAGLYYESVKCYMDLFPAEQIRIYLYEDLRADANKLVRSLYDFLEVDNAVQPDTSVQHNRSGIPKNRSLQHVQSFLLQRNNPLKEALKPLLPSQLRQRMLYNVVKQINQINLEQVPLAPETRYKLVERYREDILKLQDLLERDLSTWLNVD